MASAVATHERPPHPSPHRHLVPAATLAFGVLAAPVAWSAHLVTNFALASSMCAYGGFASLDDVDALLLVSSLVALFVCALAGSISWRIWETTRREDQGAHEALLEVGEGRTRFLGLVAMILGGGFFAATIFDTIALFVVPLCK